MSGRDHVSANRVDCAQTFCCHLLVLLRQFEAGKRLQLKALQVLKLWSHLRIAFIFEDSVCIFVANNYQVSHEFA